MKTFVVGFIFNSKEEVLLIRKLKPSWQAGFLNGVGENVKLVKVYILLW